MRRAVVLAAAAAFALVLAREASAHAVVSPPVAKAKVLQQFTLLLGPAHKTTTSVLKMAWKSILLYLLMVCIHKVLNLWH